MLLRAPPDLVTDGDPLVVAKCFQVHSFISDNELKKIHQEVKLLQKLRHEHVIRCVHARCHLHTGSQHAPTPLARCACLPGRP